MIALLTPPEISGLWRVLKIGVEQSLPPLAFEAPDCLNQILTMLVSGRMQCWLAYDHLEKGTRLNAMALTEIQKDAASGLKSLLIYSFYSYGAVSDWTQYLKPVGKWAASKGCRRVIAYSKEPRVLDIVRRLGGSSEWHFIELPIQP